ncbi:uncharacterized protein N7498_009128 [Penicillium cinerascens]|uniref:Uncharacterized protein n=1 Tax=Penicillium cinerascens TaxID=70096 RepID=A0A9W9J4Y9_9EURO|nr:uncharacterized protein N7498_009128 [Penicillium cinerascens]KAJ5190143.1 hypothetical protein N7498_009128 [Penicillium cinerascens]
MANVQSLLRESMRLRCLNGENGFRQTESLVAASPITSFSTDIANFFNYLTWKEYLSAGTQFLVGKIPFDAINCRVSATTVPTVSKFKIWY